MDTIFASITGKGGAVAVIRISGSKALDVIKIFGISVKNLIPRKTFVVKLLYQEELLDTGVLIYFQAPNSFTGEDTIELTVHNSEYIVHTILNQLSLHTCYRFAQRGEFTKQALLNGKIDLVQSEGINAVINSKSKQQLKISNKMLYGNTSQYYRNIRDLLINVISEIEARIDFPEDNILDITIDRIAALISNLQSMLNKSLKTHHAIDKIFNGINIVLFGKPNAGKSSLINAIANRQVAIVSNIAGTTRDCISTNIDIGGYIVNIFDTAGLKNHAAITDIIEKKGIKITKNILSVADIKILVVDIGDSKFDMQFFKDNKIKIRDINCVIINKSDTIKNEESFNKKMIFFKNLFKGKQLPIIAISTKTLNNLPQLITVIEEEIRLLFNTNDDLLIFNERHRSILLNTIERIKNIDLNNNIELIAEDLREIMNIINEITGNIYNDDILNNVFSKFCIGK